MSKKESNLYTPEPKQGIKRIPSLTDQLLYVEEEEKQEDFLKMSNISWASQIEEEMGDSLTDEQLTGSSTTSSWKDSSSNLADLESKNINIDKILQISLDDNKTDDVKLLNYQTIMTNNIRKSIKVYVDKYLHNKNNKEFNFTLCIKKLNWLQKVSKHFSDSLKLPIVLNAFSKTKVIPRSSYQFCDFGYDCDYNYNHKKHEGCLYQHYVHNLVYADIMSLLEYIGNVKDKSFNDIKFIEIIKCLNTLSYVIGHMYDELKHVKFYNKNNHTGLHQERTPPGKKIIKKYNKKRRGWKNKKKPN
jgi:hypothetical protein